MAQKVASSRAKKAIKKPASRKAAHATSAVKAAKPKRKGGLAKVQAKHVRKPALARQQTPAAPPVKSPVTKRPVGPPAAQARAVTKSAVPASKNMAALKQAMVTPPRPVAAPAGARTMPAAVTKTASQKIIAPRPGPLPATEKKAEAPPKKPVHQRHGFKIAEWIVYPAHGVGKIVAIEEQEIAGISLELFVITFEKDKMTLRVPTGKSQSVGMRKLADEATVKKAMETLRGRARVKRTMWSRRAQEYEAKINSGDLVSIAEVVRDLYRSESQPEQSYSERQLYEAALDRMGREIAVVEKLDERGAMQRITEVLAKSARGRRLAAEEAETKAA